MLIVHVQLWLGQMNSAVNVCQVGSSRSEEDICMVWGLTRAAWAVAAHLAVCMQKRTWGCVGKLCPVIVIGHECRLSEARSEA